MPDRGGLDRYNASYFENAHGGAAVAESARAFHRAINYVRANHVESERVAIGATIRTVLEIGPGLGDFGARWTATHPDTTYYAVESDEQQRERLCERGIRAVGSLEEVPTGLSFDLLVLSHVLEHTSDPRAFLSKFVQRMNPGAMVFIEVPCRDYEHKSEDEPHLLFFDGPSMSRLLTRVGIRPLRISYHGIEIERLRRRSGSLARRIAARALAVLDALRLLPIPRAFDGVTDPAGRAAVRSLEGHVEKRSAAWWLRAVGVVEPTRGS
jgi:SAM-dependent methyltransferase